jgi:hypothetical protein
MMSISKKKKKKLVVDAMSSEDFNMVVFILFYSSLPRKYFLAKSNLFCFH